jgi:tripeptide aminopeptidase
MSNRFVSELGVPTPNVFTGMQEIHGPLEWVSLQDIAAATEVCIRLAQLWAVARPRERKVEHGPESPAETGAAVDWTDAIQDRWSGG